MDKVSEQKKNNNHPTLLSIPKQIITEKKKKKPPTKNYPMPRRREAKISDKWEKFWGGVSEHRCVHSIVPPMPSVQWSAIAAYVHECVQLRFRSPSDCNTEEQGKRVKECPKSEK